MICSDKVSEFNKMGNSAEMCVCVHHCLHTVDVYRDMSQVVTGSGWRRLGPVPGMYEWKSLQTIVLPSETAAIYRIWKRVGSGKDAQPVCWETLGNGRRLRNNWESKQCCCKATFPV